MRQTALKTAAETASANNDTNDNEAGDRAPSFKKGRPRSEKSRASILRATNSLLLHKSVQELSIEAIAKKAKVGKTTIYRWWPNKTAVVMEAMVMRQNDHVPVKPARNNEEAILVHLEKLISLLKSKNGEVIAQLFSEAQGDIKSQEIFENTFLAPLIDAIGYSIDRGKKDGEFGDVFETRMAVDIVCGPIFFRLMAHPADLNDEFQDAYLSKALNFLKL